MQRVKHEKKLSFLWYAKSDVKMKIYVWKIVENKSEPSKQYISKITKLCNNRMILLR